MKIAIVDDNAEELRRLHGYFNELLDAASDIVGFSSGEDFLAVWPKENFDLIVLDIFMDNVTGMDVARKIRETDSSVKLVFSTTSNEFASESYEVNACYYLHKPFGAEQVKAMLDRIDIAKLDEMRTVRLPDGNSVILRDIIYADFSSHRVALHCKYGKSICVRSAFSEIEPLLCAYRYFFSPCKGVVINFYEVGAQNADTFTMCDGTIIPISRRKAREVLDAYSSFRFEMLRKGGES